MKDEGVIRSVYFWFLNQGFDSHYSYAMARKHTPFQL